MNIKHLVAIALLISNAGLVHAQDSQRLVPPNCGPCPKPGPGETFVSGDCTYNAETNSCGGRCTYKVPRRGPNGIIVGYFTSKFCPLPISPVPADRDSAGQSSETLTDPKPAF